MRTINIRLEKKICFFGHGSKLGGTFYAFLLGKDVNSVPFSVKSLNHAEKLADYGASLATENLQKKHSFELYRKTVQRELMVKEKICIANIGNNEFQSCRA